VCNVNGHKSYVHRSVWEHYYGSISAHLCVLHGCDNPACSNIDHLFLGTKADNNKDMHNKNRHAVGDDMPHAKLSDEKVTTARCYYASGGVTLRQVAEDYGVAVGTMRNALTGRTWKHVREAVCAISQGTPPQTVLAIKAMHGVGRNQRAIAKTFRLHPNTIGRIVTGKRHAEVV